MKRLYLSLLFLLFFVNLFSQDTLKNNDINRHFDSTYFPSGFKTINVYAKMGCERCTSIVELLEMYKVPFNEFDLDNDSIFRRVDSLIHIALPYKNLGYSIGFPVIQIDSVIFFNIANHTEFVNELKEYLQKHKK